VKQASPILDSTSPLEPFDLVQDLLGELWRNATKHLDGISLVVGA
jgi:hypothetical protein